jgi:glycosyltransferase involved in cell wall biosynthesis
MKHAACFFFPSLYEGFGLPALEAMSLGVPTITSDRSSLPEVAGEGAITVDPENPEAISSVLEKVLADRKLRDALSKKGVAQAEKFSWEKCAEETLAVYKYLSK